MPEGVASKGHSYGGTLPNTQCCTMLPNTTIELRSNPTQSILICGKSGEEWMAHLQRD